MLFELSDSILNFRYKTNICSGFYRGARFLIAFKGYMDNPIATLAIRSKQMLGLDPTLSL